MLVICRARGKYFADAERSEPENEVKAVWLYHLCEPTTLVMELPLIR